MQREWELSLFIIKKETRILLYVLFIRSGLEFTIIFPYFVLFESYDNCVNKVSLVSNKKQTTKKKKREKEKQDNGGSET